MRTRLYCLPGPEFQGQAFKQDKYSDQLLIFLPATSPAQICSSAEDLEATTGPTFLSLQTVSGRLCSIMILAFRRVFVDGPLNVHCLAVMSFNFLPNLGKLNNIQIHNTLSVLSFYRNILFYNAMVFRITGEQKGFMGNGFLIISLVTLLTIKLSGVHSPLTTLSPNPQFASMAMDALSPVAGFKVNMTPAVQAFAIF